MALILPMLLALTRTMLETIQLVVSHPRKSGQALKLLLPVYRGK